MHVVVSTVHVHVLIIVHVHVCVGRVPVSSANIRVSDVVLVHKVWVHVYVESTHQGMGLCFI